jgi:sugar phosphate isomerase/epimerase
MAIPPPYRFGVSEFTTQPWTFDEDVARYARLGVDAIEVAEVKLDPDRIEAQMRLIAEHALAVSSVQPATRTLFPSRSQPEPEDVGVRMGRFRDTIARLASYTPGVPFVTNMGIAPDGDFQQALDTAVREYRALAEYAADQGVRVALEPLNAVLVNAETSVWTLAQGLEIVRAVGHPHFGICLDLWNVWQNADIADAIRACGDRTFVLQLADWRTPRSFQDRLVPGHGEIPLPPLLRAVHESGYRGPYVVEIFSGGVPDSLWEGDLEQVLRDSRAGLDAAWARAFA